MTQDKYEKEMETYGFGIGGTGGNCTAFWKDMKLGDSKLEILIANECETPRIGDWAVVQFSDYNGNNFSFELKDHNAVLMFAKSLITN